MRTQIARPLALFTMPALLAAGCYGAAPPRPAPVALPDLSAGGALTVATEETTTIEDVDKKSETCPQGQTAGGPDCIVTHYTEREPVTTTTTTAADDGAPISYGQFRVLTDPDRDHELARLADLSKKCTRANLPRNVGVGLAIAGLIGLSIGTKVEGVALVGVGLAVAGFASFGLGYFAFGGRDCNRANALYRELDVTGDLDATVVYGEGYATKMKELADRFNAGTSRAASTN
jgi:hypothetical protein